MTTIKPAVRVGKEIFHRDLQCYVRSISYDYETRAGRLVIADDAGCDMCGCLRLFESVDPSVKLIEVFCGEDKDTTYVRRPRLGWEAVRADGVAMGSFVKPGLATARGPGWLMRRIAEGW
jgi:hypothetical protein